MRNAEKVFPEPLAPVIPSSSGTRFRTAGAIVNVLFVVVIV